MKSVIKYIMSILPISIPLLLLLLLLLFYIFPDEMGTESFETDKALFSLNKSTRTVLNL